MRQLQLQKAIYDKLKTDLNPIQVYDNVPQNASFPYVAIGEDTAIEWETDEVKGTESTLTIHIWSRQKSRVQTKTIMGQVYTALSRASLTLTAGTLVTIDFEFGETLLDADGETRHGIMRFRALIEG